MGYTEYIKTSALYRKRSFAFMNIDIGSKIKALRYPKA